MRRRITITAIVAVLLAQASAQAVLDGDPATTEWLTTSDGEEGAIQLSQALWSANSAPAVILTRDDKVPDALAGTVLTRSGPMLLTPTDALPPAVEEELDRALANDGTVYLLGGTSAISAAIEQRLNDAGRNVKRLRGTGRIETALAVATEAEVLYGPSPDLFLARAFGTESNPTALWADAVSVGPRSALTSTPVLITPTGELAPAVAEWIRSRVTGTTVLIGGTSALSEAVRAAVPGRSTRIRGSGRAETAAAIASGLWGFNGEGPRNFVLLNAFDADGWKFGLPAAGLGRRGVAMLLVQQDLAPQATVDFLGSTTCEVDLLALGDDGVISNEMLRNLHDLDKGCTGTGRRDDPHPLGDPAVTGDGFEVTVLSMDANANAEVANENSFNDPPEAGHRYVMPRIRIRYVGHERWSRPDASFRLRIVGDRGVAYTTFENSCGVVPDPIVDTDLWPGGAIEGNVCFEVPDGDVDSLVLFDDGGFTTSRASSGYHDTTGSPPPATALPEALPPTGTRANPVPLNTPVLLKSDWEVTLLSYDEDANGRVMTENSFNEAPEPGHQFVIARLRFTNKSEDFGPADENLGAVGPYRGRAYLTFNDHCGVIPDPVPSNDVEPGGSVEGNICFAVDSRDASGLVLFDDPFFDFDDDGYRPYLGTN